MLDIFSNTQQQPFSTAPKEHFALKKISASTLDQPTPTLGTLSLSSMIPSFMISYLPESLVSSLSLSNSNSDLAPVVTHSDTKFYSRTLLSRLRNTEHFEEVQRLQMGQKEHMGSKVGNGNELFESSRRLLFLASLKEIDIEARGI
jgi:hypothetical protein